MKIIQLTLLFSTLSVSSLAIIGGQEMDPFFRPEVVELKTSHNYTCSAVLIGPRALLTSCGKDKAAFSTKISGKEHEGELIRSPYRENFSISVGILDEAVSVKPASLNIGKTKQGDFVKLYGYGCGTVGGGDDFSFRKGMATVEKIHNHFHFISKGSGICFGDGGGPAYLVKGGNLILVGIASMGNILDTNYHIRVNIDETSDFVKKVADLYELDICGVNIECDPISFASGDSDLVFKSSVFEYVARVDKKLDISLRDLLVDIGLEGKELSWSTPNAPWWVRIKEENETLYALPSETGQYSFSITVNDGKSVAKANIEITVGP